MRMDAPPAQPPVHQRAAWLVLFLLLVLRIPYTIAIIYLLPIENQSGAAIYEAGTYLLTCFLIWWERERLAEFHIDLFALFLILLARPAQTFILAYWGVDSPMAFPRPLGLGLWVVSLGLGAALWRGGFKPARAGSRSLLWLAVGLLLGIGLSIAENFPAFLATLSAPHPPQTGTPLLSSAALNILYHLGFAPINEEPLFRGFLWGYLRQLKWRENLIWLFQAVLFTSAHVYFAAQFPLMFWVLIPLAGLLFGLLAWRSRSIAPAIFAHAMVNGSAYLFFAVLLIRSVN
jgi:membrane protease YdiL (CAAX protease family)